MTTVKLVSSLSQAACATCHKPPLYTVPALKDVGVFDEYDGYRDYKRAA
jgi:cytochrome c551/c552